MPIRHLIAIPLLLAACTAPEPETVEIAQPERGGGGRYGSCPHAYPCQPGTPWSVVICDAVCGQEGGYCEPYSPQEEEWCILNPGIVENGLVMCDRWGNPTWRTVCLPYVMP